jgi:hypothetical protein
MWQSLISKVCTQLMMNPRFRSVAPPSTKLVSSAKSTASGAWDARLSYPTLRAETTRRLYGATDIMPLPGHFVSRKRETSCISVGEKAGAHKNKIVFKNLKTTLFTNCHW